MDRPRNAKKGVRLVIGILSEKAGGTDTSVLEREIDVLAYNLYGLSYEGVQVIEPEFGLSAAEHAGVEV